MPQEVGDPEFAGHNWGALFASLPVASFREVLGVMTAYPVNKASLYLRASSRLDCLMLMTTKFRLW